MSLGAYIAIKEAQLTLLCYLVANLLREAYTEKVLNVLRAGLLCHFQVTRDHWVKPLLLRGRSELPDPSSYTAVLAIFDDKHPELVICGTSLNPPATPLLRVYIDCPLGISS